MACLNESSQWPFLASYLSEYWALVVVLFSKSINLWLQGQRITQPLYLIGAPDFLAASEIQLRLVNAECFGNFFAAGLADGLFRLKLGIGALGDAHACCNFILR